MRLSGFKNFYCEPLLESLTRVFQKVENLSCKVDVLALREQAKNLAEEKELEIFNEFFSIQKELGVNELHIRSDRYEYLIELFEKHKFRGRVLLSLEKLLQCSSSAFSNDRIGLYLEDICSFTDGKLSEIAILAGKMKVPLYIKFATSLEEVGALNVRFKCSPVEVLEEFGFLEGECYLIGCNFLDKDDLKILKDHEITIILTPQTDMFLAHGGVNLLPLMQNGISIGFGSGFCPPNLEKEAGLAVGNTNNLMYETGLISSEYLLSALKGKE